MELADHRPHPAIMVNMMVADNDQVELVNPSIAEKFDHPVRRAGVDQGSLPLGRRDQRRIPLPHVEELDRRLARNRLSDPRS